MVLEAIRDRIVVDDRIDNLRNIVDDVKDEGVWPALDGLMRGFGRNNRKLVGGVLRR